MSFALAMMSSEWNPQRKATTMAIQIGAKPDSGFGDPIGMLKDCHRRIEHFLHVLCLVADRAGSRTVTGEEATAVRSAFQYVRIGGRRHAADEEESLFPRLQEDANAEDFEEVNGLEDDHHHANDLHDIVGAIYSAWIFAGRLSDGDKARLLSATTRLQTVVRRTHSCRGAGCFSARSRDVECPHYRSHRAGFRIRRQAAVNG